MDEKEIEENIENALQLVKNVWFSLGVFHGMDVDSLDEIDDMLEENEELHENYMRALDFLEKIIEKKGVN